MNREYAFTTMHASFYEITETRRTTDIPEIVIPDYQRTSIHQVFAKNQSQIMPAKQPYAPTATTLFCLACGMPVPWRDRPIF